jgi:hypothetical protein
LVIPTSVIGESNEPVLAFAEDRLPLINGVGRLLSSEFRAVSLTGKVLGLNSSGVVCHTAIAVGNAEMRVKASAVGIAIGGAALPHPAEGLAAPLFVAASYSARAHDALVIVGRQDHTWSELYLLFELVEADVGGEMYERGWISKADANLFTRTANSYSALRSTGRHGKDTGDPPRNPMEHAAAVSLVRALVLAWLKFVGSLGANRASATAR